MIGWDLSNVLQHTLDPMKHKSIGPCSYIYATTCYTIAFTVQTVGDVAVGTHYFANGFLSLETPKLFLNQS